MIHLHFLHGFMGHPSDWHPVLDQLHEFSNIQIHNHALYKEASPELYPSLKQAAEKIFSKIKHGKHIIVGYSMGGRMALHIPPAAWPFVRGIVLVSTHLGLSNAEEIEERVISDQSWAKKFRTQSWDSIMNEWNSQAIFAHDLQRPLRLKEQYTREELAQSLTSWSLSQQAYFLKNWPQFPFVVKYIYGEKDEKFSRLAAQIADKSLPIQIKTVLGGHSVPFNQPNDLFAHLKEFLITKE